MQKNGNIYSDFFDPIQQVLKYVPLSSEKIEELKLNGAKLTQE
jgi:hypothetical protein